MLGLYPTGNNFGMNSLNGLSGLMLSGGYTSGLYPQIGTSCRMNYFATQKNGGLNPTGQTQNAPVNTQTVPQTQGQQIPINTPQVPQGPTSLQGILENAKAKQGFLGKAVDGLKNMTGIGFGSKKCQKYIDEYLQGKRSFEEIYNAVSKFENSQKTAASAISIGASLLLAGISTAKAIKTGKGFDVKLILTSAGIGAGTNSTLKGLDRATNGVKGDTLSVGEIAKDMVQGGMAGAISGTVTGAIKSSGFENKGKHNSTEPKPQPKGDTAPIETLPPVGSGTRPARTHSAGEVIDVEVVNTEILPVNNPPVNGLNETAGQPLALPAPKTKDVLASMYKPYKDTSVLPVLSAPEAYRNSSNALSTNVQGITTAGNTVPKPINVPPVIPSNNTPVSNNNIPVNIPETISLKTNTDKGKMKNLFNNILSYLGLGNKQNVIKNTKKNTETLFNKLNK